MHVLDVLFFLFFTNSNSTAAWIVGLFQAYKARGGGVFKNRSQFDQT